MCLTNRFSSQPAGLEEYAAKLGIRHQAGVFVLFGTAARFFQSRLLQGLPCRFGQGLHADGAESSGLSFLAVFFVAAAELLLNE